ncbi:acyltransferase [Psychromonas algicola]|uniref:acyltransferase n=1 Tax=Psychromonas algicola TaxID=2555642 RepID=UPI0010685668|nr:acyltransferase [Psychromonas sp. RZ5]TEW52680.1 acyltransferase [Psychromonas sp. RZ5]
MSYLLLFLSTILVILNTAVVSMIMVACAIAKWLIPILASQRFFSKMANQIMWCWATINKFLLTLFNNVEWQVTGNESLNKESWYLLMSNHISWTDIVVLSSLFKDSMPMTKFFVKKQLLFVPFVGLACWALDMPFMRRYSSQYLLKHPEKRIADMKSTRKACEKFQQVPTTIVNYVEGSRVTPLKQQQTDSPYQYLLKPKAGGIAYTLAAMGEQFDCILDVTLAYPQNRETPFKDLLMGKMKKIVVQINVIEITAEVQGDYFNDPIYKQQFQQWLSQVWQKKDQRLAEIYKKN